jgi:hypothetical protein
MSTETTVTGYNVSETFKDFEGNIIGQDKAGYVFTKDAAGALHIEKDEEGKPMVATVRIPADALTLKRVSISALMGYKKERETTEETWKKFELSNKINGTADGESVQLSLEDRTRILDCIHATHSSIVFGNVKMLFEK